MPLICGLPASALDPTLPHAMRGRMATEEKLNGSSKGSYFRAQILHAVAVLCKSTRSELHLKLAALEASAYPLVWPENEPKWICSRPLLLGKKHSQRDER